MQDAISTACQVEGKSTTTIYAPVRTPYSPKYIHTTRLMLTVQSGYMPNSSFSENECAMTMSDNQLIHITHMITTTHFTSKTVVVVVVVFFPEELVGFQMLFQIPLLIIW